MKSNFEWEVGDIVNLGSAKNLKVTAVYPIKTAKGTRNRYLLQSAADEKIKYKYSFEGGLVRVY